MPYQTDRKRLRAISAIFQHGKTQIPSEVRIALNLFDGDKLAWYIENGKWVIEKA